MEIDDRWYTRPPGVPTHDAAGGIVVRVREGRIEVALVRDGDAPSYVLPKGHVEPGESLQAAARREIAEEAGLLDLTLLGEAGVRERLNFERTSWKRTTFFIFLYMLPDAPAHGAARRAGAFAEWFLLDMLPAIFWPEQRALLREQRDRIVALATKAAVQQGPPRHRR